LKKKIKIMKKLLFCFIALTILISCDDLLSISSAVTFDQEIDLSSNGDEEVISIEQMATIDPSSSSSYEEIKSRIDEVAIDKITYTLTENLAGHNADAVLTLNLSFAPAGDPNKRQLETVEAALDVSGEEKEITLSDEDLITFQTLLENGNAIDIYASGDLIDGPVNVTVLFKIYTTITASP
jgi:hypothetical protein